MIDDSLAVLASLTESHTYNSGTSGYGPYLHLPKAKETQMKPRQVHVGLYIGDDCKIAPWMSYDFEYRFRLRSMPAEIVDLNVWQAPSATTRNQRV